VFLFLGRRGGGSLQRRFVWTVPLEPGDLILAHDAGAAGRRGGVDRVGVVISVGAKEGVSWLPADSGRWLRAAAPPLVLRPSWSGAAMREEFVTWFDGVVDRRLETWRTPRLLFRLMLKHRLARATPLARIPVDPTSWAISRTRYLALDRRGRELLEQASNLAVRRPPPLPPRGSPEPRGQVLPLA
jgi:hypothetical protein